MNEEWENIDIKIYINLLYYCTHSSSTKIRSDIAFRV